MMKRLLFYSVELSTSKYIISVANEAYEDITLNDILRGGCNHVSVGLIEADNPEQIEAALQLVLITLQSNIKEYAIQLFNRQNEEKKGRDQN